VTGSMADHRLRMAQADIGWFARVLMFVLASRGVESLKPIADIIQRGSGSADLEGLDTTWLAPLADD